MKIRKVDIVDIDVLVAISRQTFVETFGPVNDRKDTDLYLKQKMSKESLLTQLQLPTVVFYFIEKDNLVVGYMKCIDKLDYVLLQRIYIQKQYQANGFGAKLIDYLKLISTQAIRLSVWDQANKAIEFYKNHGFAIIGTEQFQLGCDYQTDYIMEYQS